MALPLTDAATMQLTPESREKLYVVVSFTADDGSTPGHGSGPLAAREDSRSHCPGGSGSWNAWARATLPGRGWSAPAISTF
jgi:hypothetical protein